MADLALRVQGLSKAFRLGRQPAYYRFSEFIENVARNVARLPRRLVQSTTPASTPAETFWALDDVSFEVPRGDVLGIIGRNGAGKSTLLKLLSRVTAPTRGTIEMQGRIGSLLEVGTGFHPELTGRENIFLNGAFIGMSQREVRAKFDEIVAFAEVEKFLDSPIKHYSSGMQMRLAFAVAAHLEPEILIIDEVLAVGDAAFQKKCLGMMQGVASRGSTCVVVSHNLPLVANFCRRAILLKDGKVAATGTASEVVQNYLASSLSLGGEVVWNDPSTAPGDDRVRLHAVRVLQDENTGPTADVKISEEIVIELEYWNLQPDRRLYAAIWLKDQIATPVLSTSSVNRVSLTPDAWACTPHPRGLYRSVCRLPANFLNDGRYVITAIVGFDTGEPQIIYEDAVSFQVHDTGVMRGDYLGNWLGVVRPRLPWATTRLEPPESGSVSPC